LDYPIKYEQAQQLLGLREPSRPNFYRTEFSNWYLENENSLYGYDGISIYSSTANYNLSKFLTGIGMRGWRFGMRHRYIETSPLTSSFLNIRYLISLDGYSTDNSVIWKEAGYADDSLLLENKYYLPLGFMVKNETAGYEQGENPFASQNNLFQLATGLNGNLFTITNLREAEQEPGSGAPLKWLYEMPDNGMLYAYYADPYFSDVRLSKNGEELRKVNIALYPYLFTAGNFLKGDLICFEPSVGDGNFASTYAGYLNLDLFEEGYNLLADETLSLSHFSDTRVKGNITALSDGMLYVSIPYSTNWKVFVNGKKGEILPIGGGMSGITLQKGVYEIEFLYINNAFNAGIVISVISLAVFTVHIIRFKRRYVC
jgi:uncharacterized membrane protein YfhO